jgi:hypothetical protein
MRTAFASGTKRGNASADGRLCAAPRGRPECTPTAAYSSGYVSAITAGIAPPAERPGTYTRRLSSLYVSTTSSVMPAMIDGSPCPRRWWPGLNQFQHFETFAHSSTACWVALRVVSYRVLAEVSPISLRRRLLPNRPARSVPRCQRTFAPAPVMCEDHPPEAHPEADRGHGDRRFTKRLLTPG